MPLFRSKICSWRHSLSFQRNVAGTAVTEVKIIRRSLSAQRMPRSFWSPAPSWPSFLPLARSSTITVRAFSSVLMNATRDPSGDSTTFS